MASNTTPAEKVAVDVCADPDVDETSNDDPLEYFVAKPTTAQVDCNPFYVSVKTVADKIKTVNLARETLASVNLLNASHYPIKTVLIMCLRDGAVASNAIYNPDITPEVLRDICSQYCLIRCSVKILQTPMHLKSALIVSKAVLENIDHSDITLSEYEMVIPLFELQYTTALTYAKMYKVIGNDFKKLTEVIELKKFYGANYQLSFDFVDSILDDCCWKYLTSEFNMTNIVAKRKMTKYADLDIHQVQTDYQFGSPDLCQNCNVYSAMRSSNNRKYFVSDPTYLSIGIDMATVTNMFASLTDRHSMYNLFNAFALSKQYCHLVVNNPQVLRLMKPIFRRYKQTYINVLTYPMLAFYIEESVFGTKAQKNYRYIMTIDTAHELPTYMYSANDVHMSPYNIIPIADSNFSENLYGLRFSSQYKYYGIDTLEGFRRKFNLFTTRTLDKNIFDGINWKSFAVTGSAIPACVPTRSPLVDTVATDIMPYEIQMLKYFDKYYGTSDIDVVCTETTLDGFFQETHNVVQQVKKNLSVIDDSIIVTPVKMARVHIHKLKLEKMLDELYATNPELKNLQHIEKHLNDNEIIRKFFHSKYIQCKHAKYENVTPATPIHKMYIDDCPLENFRVSLARYNLSETTNATECLLVETIPNPNNKPYQTNSMVVYKIEETIRFKVSDNPKNQTKLLLRPFEVFRSRDGSEAFSTVAKFHLPCVRGYYDGNNVYMTPSCVMSHLTYMNIDYKYFAGSCEPVEIILKYLGRGYGTYLNKTELHIVTQACAGKEQYAVSLLDMKIPSNPLYGGTDASQYTYISGTVFRPVDGARNVFDANGNVLPVKTWSYDEIWKSVNAK